MTTDEQTAQYTPTNEEARECYSAGRPGWETGTPAEFDRFLARVRRDAAREALDGYADAEEDNFLALHVKGAPISAAQCTHAAITAREYRDTHYPEGDDQ